MAPDETTQAYIDAEKREKAKRQARRENAEALRTARLREQELLRERDEKAQEHHERIQGQKAEVQAAKDLLAEGEKKLKKFQEERNHELQPLRAELRAVQRRRRVGTVKSAKLNPTKTAGRMKVPSPYPKDARSWPGPKTDFATLSQQKGLNPQPHQGGLADGRGRNKRKPTRVNVTRRGSV